jgi:membrane associated rhomboid family serine protease
MDNNYNRPLFDPRSFFTQRTALTYLVLVNIAVFLIIQVIRVPAYLMNPGTSGTIVADILNYLAVPAYIPALARHPWTLLTYMFLHEDIWHILFNMLWLFWFGKIFLEYLSQGKLWVVYILGGLSGGIIYILAFNTFPVFHSYVQLSYALGASASVMAVVTAISFYVPNYSLYMLFFGRVKIVYLAIALFIIDFFMIPAGNAGGHIAHIGGALFGFFYARFILPRAIGNHFPLFSDMFAGLKKIFSRGRRASDPIADRGRAMSDDDYNLQKAERQKRIDQILEKISKGGYDSLTREEKDFLFKSSGKN